MTTQTEAASLQRSRIVLSSPRAHAWSSASQSPSSRGTRTCVSGSPKRALYSSTFGPGVRQHDADEQHAAKRAPFGGEPADGRDDDRRAEASPASRRRAKPTASTSPCRRCSVLDRHPRRACSPGRMRAPTDVTPSASTKNDVSRPVSISSTTMRRPASPNALPESMLLRRVDRGAGIVRDDDALSRGQPIRLDDERIRGLRGTTDSRDASAGVVEDPERRGRDPVPRHELLRERLAPFDHGRRGARARRCRAPPRASGRPRPETSGASGPTTTRSYALGDRVRGERLDVLGCDRNSPRVARDARRFRERKRDR